MARRWISIVLAFLMLANLAAGSSSVLAEVLEHEHEAPQLDLRTSPAESAPTHCQHGCAGHFGHHFQGQVPALAGVVQRSKAEPVVPAPTAASPRHISAQPFRPPLLASIRS